MSIPKYKIARRVTDPPRTIGEAAEAVSVIQARPNAVEGIEDLHEILEEAVTVENFDDSIPVVVEDLTNLLINTHRVMLDSFHSFIELSVDHTSLNSEAVDSILKNLCDIAEFSRKFRATRFRLASKCNPASLLPDSQLRADAQVARITYLADQCIGMMTTLEQQYIEHPSLTEYRLTRSHRSGIEINELEPMGGVEIFESAPALNFKSAVLWSKLDGVKNSSALIQKSRNGLCPVCLESMIAEDVDFAILDSCWHLFCKKCSFAWLETSSHR